MSHIIIGTAGHIDHGKTALVLALTGMDTDRLKEEKERQITIDLGFAFLGKRAAIIDVPGHERFIKNMVAGVATIDMVLFVVAADDGVMPQTREHLDILRILGVKTGIIAITKADIVEPEWLELVKTDVQDLMQDTFLENAPIFVVDSISGRGIEPLRDALDQTIDALPGKTDRGMFRLPIDRVFSMRGFGTVITGTVLSGSAQPDAILEIQPQGIKVKVRGVQSHAKPVDKVTIGDRAALNLQGVEVSQIKRGDVIADPGYFHPTTVLDGRMILLPSAAPFAHRTRVRVHIGTQEVIGRVTLLDRDSLEPGGEAPVRIRLEHDCVAARKDPFVVRQYSPQITIGGGVVLDPAPSGRRKRFDPAVIDRMKALDQDNPESLIIDSLRTSTRLEMSQKNLLTLTGLTREKLTGYLKTLEDQGKVIRIGDGERSVLIHPDRLNQSKQTMINNVRNHHQQNPLLPGISLAELRRRCEHLFPQQVCDLVLEDLVSHHQLISERHWIHTPDHKIQLSPVQQQTITRIEQCLKTAGFQTPKADQIADQLDLSPNEVRDLITIMVNMGTVVRIASDLLFLQEQISQIKQILDDNFQTKPQVTVGEVGKLLNSTRKYVVPVLEYLDHEGFTERHGDVRVRKTH